MDIALVLVVTVGFVVVSVFLAVAAWSNVKRGRLCPECDSPNVNRTQEKRLRGGGLTAIVLDPAAGSGRRWQYEHECGTCGHRYWRS